MAVGWSQSPILTVDSLLSSREKIDVGENDGAMHWLGKWAVPLAQDYLDLTGGAVPKSLNLIKPMGRSLEAISSGLNPVNDVVHTYTDAANAVNYVKSVPGRVGAAKDKAVTGVKNWYTDSVEAGKHGMTRKQYHAERAATPAGETAQTGGRAAETAETAASAAERTAASETAAPAAERTAASETAAPAPRQEPAPAPERTAASETAADGGVSELANAGNAGRGTAATGGQAAGREAAAASEAAAGREATTAGEQAAGREAAATGALSNFDRKQYLDYINGVQNDSGLADLVQPTLDRVVGGTGRSIDSLSDAELSAFYEALNKVVDKRWALRIIGGAMND